MAHIKSGLKTAALMRQGRMPGQLVIQITDRCNATCPQCGMRKTNKFDRTRLTNDQLREIIDAAGEKGFAAISFTGGEPMLLRRDLPELIRRAGQAGIPYIRTGTNGFFFADHDKPDFEDKIKAIADELADTPLRNFWISLDSSVTGIHEQMRGFNGVVRGMEKALPIFHNAGLFPSVNLGLNRNVSQITQGLCSPAPKDLADPEASPFYRAFAQGFAAFYRKVIDMGFTIANACYPMSMDDSTDKEGLDAVYAAASADRVVCFTGTEKALLFKALWDTIPKFRSKIRIFSPLASLHTLYNVYSSNNADTPYGCRGGIDFFYLNCTDGNTYPCGYRGADNLGPFPDLNVNAIDPKGYCLACDWECFRDPTELGGPFMEAVAAPWRLAARMAKDPGYGACWFKDLQYYKACDFFDGRRPPRTSALQRF
ncbi:radical SAM protein [uncultured Desulfobacter sp.]|uniref:radical SAM protein n=1 Tax=uncultured Desulfobacter sp. TaxID=240139 RepID=UPI002AAC0CC5|nr:radical SAM protein [uncultured Desulfobacter sp.]